MLIGSFRTTTLEIYAGCGWPLIYWIFSVTLCLPFIPSTSVSVVPKSIDESSFSTVSYGLSWSSTICFSTTISSIGDIKAILTFWPTLNKLFLLVNSGLTIKNSSVDNLLLNATVSIVSPSLTVYSSPESKVPNNKYLVRSVTLVKIISSVETKVSLIDTSWLKYIFSILLPVVLISGWVSFL